MPHRRCSTLVSRAGLLAFALAGLAASASSAPALALTLSGTVVNESGAAQSNVDIDLIDVCSGDSLFLTNDRTAANGSYSITVAAGTYDVRFTPPAGATVAAEQKTDVVIAANTNLGTTVLHPGRLVSGTVRNTSSQGIAGVDLKFVEAATGTKIYVTKDLTGAAGTYSVRVRPGTYDVEYRPPSTTAYLTGRRPNLAVGTSDVSGLTDTLGTGLNVTGEVRDKAGNRLKNVDINAFDTCTGQKVATAHDNTNANGQYSIYVPAGTYTFTVNPPACKGLTTERLPDEIVDRATSLGTSTLDTGLTVSGRAVNAAGQPVANAQVKFYDAVKGTRQGAAHDNTGADGRFAVAVPQNTYDINVEPPYGTDLLVGRAANVAVQASLDLGDIVLGAGVPLTGHVTGPGGQPVPNVNINIVDAVTRASVRLSHDASNTAGDFRVVTPNGTFDLQYAPPACTGLAPDAQRAIGVAGATAAPPMALVAGVHVLGTVRDPATLGVAAADLDLFVPGDAQKAYTPHDATDAAGGYDVTVVPRTYDIRYSPPSGVALRPAWRRGVSLLATTTLPDTYLPAGWLVSGAVVADATSLATGGVQVEFHRAGGPGTPGVPGVPAPLYTPHNNTGADGLYNVAVDAGTWDLRYVPPAASGLAPRWRRGVPVTWHTTLPQTRLLALAAPFVASVSPASGTAVGGTAITVAGSGFQPDAVVLVGGITARSIQVVSATQITAVVPAHPAGRVAVSVVNPGNMSASLASAFTFVEPANPVRLTVRRQGNDVVLSWPGNGQASYTVFSAPGPASFDDGSVRGTTGAPGWTDTGAAASHLPGVTFYVVE